MTRWLEKINRWLSLPTILIGFWSIFWLLNGMDKFFNLTHFYGVTRDEKFIGYFARLNLPADLALNTLTVIGFSEIVLGCSFLALFSSTHWRPILSELNFKASMLIFMLFSVGDILFGDRQELWEHGTFIVLVLTSFVIFQRYILSDNQEARLTPQTEPTLHPVVGLPTSWFRIFNEPPI